MRITLSANRERKQFIKYVEKMLRDHTVQPRKKVWEILMRGRSRPSS